MRRFALWIVVPIVLSVLIGGADGQTTHSIAPPDPYRNFLGSWSGTINAESMPKTVKLTISEESGRGRMRWDYVFGVKGEKGYTHDTKWVTLLPAKSKMRTHWEDQSEIIFDTQGLAGFVEKGFGSFAAEESRSYFHGYNATFSRVTFELQPNTFAYLWETSYDGKNYRAYSKAEFKRDNEPQDNQQ